MINYRMHKVPEVDIQKISADPILKAQILKAIEENPNQLKKVPEEYFSTEIARAAAECSRKTLSFVPENVANSTMGVDAVTLPKEEFEAKYPQMKR